MKKIYWILVVIAVLIVIFIMIFRPGGEDSWIKDKRGVWIKHGYPSDTPDYVLEQQEIIVCALQLYQEEKNQGMDFVSQCLGTCDDYAIDVVHVPRDDKDNKIENQCEDYRNRIATHFIELDKNGNIVRII